MDSKELLETALRVLVAWNHRREPAPADLEVLRRALPECANIPADDLACLVIHTFSRKLGQECDRNRRDTASMEGAA